MTKKGDGNPGSFNYRRSTEHIWISFNQVFLWHIESMIQYFDRAYSRTSSWSRVRSIVVGLPSRVIECLTLVNPGCFWMSRR